MILQIEYGHIVQGFALEMPTFVIWHKESPPFVDYFTMRTEVVGRREEIEF